MKKSKKHKPKNLRLLTYFNFFLDFRPYTVVAILYFQQITGSFALGMLIPSIVMISSAAFEIPTGVLSDKIGRKKTMMLGSIADHWGSAQTMLLGELILLPVIGMYWRLFKNQSNFKR
jgi:MFS family permease